MTERYLLDTNVVSELCRPEPNVSVVDFVSQLDQFWLSVISVHELRYGLALLRTGKKRERIEQALQTLTTRYSSHLIHVDNRIAERAGSWRADARLQGKTLHLADALIGASASAAGNLIVATRNISVLQLCPVRCHNPFQPDGSIRKP